MPDINAWAGNSFPLSAWSDDADQAYDTARIIADKTIAITATRLGVAQSAQNVRIETFSRGERSVTVNGVSHDVDAIVFGYAGHPTITNTDLQAGDRFVAYGQRFEVISVLVALPDIFQAHCQAKD